MTLEWLFCAWLYSYWSESSRNRLRFNESILCNAKQIDQFIFLFSKIYSYSNLWKRREINYTFFIPYFLWSVIYNFFNGKRNKEKKKNLLTAVTFFKSGGWIAHGREIRVSFFKIYIRKLVNINVQFINIR